MKKHCFSHPPSPKFTLLLCIVIVGLCTSFPAFTDAARPGGGTMTTMVLTYTYGAPARWVARVDPEGVKAFKLSVMFDPHLTVDTVIPKAPFGIVPALPPPGGNIVTITGDTLSGSPGDVDIFEILFKPCVVSGCPPPPPETARPLGSGPLTENFDGVVAPALPMGWTTSNGAGAAPLWITSDNGSPMPPADSVPNAALIEDSGFGSVSDARLDSPTIAIETASAQLTFRNNFRLNPGREDGVLEISINGGAFSDIIAAGGSFVTGGYNATVTSVGNPLGGRMAWSGLAFSSFRTTVVNLPASAAGQNIVLRWRMACGSNGSAASPGWRIDNISIADPPPPLPGPFMVFANNNTDDFLDALDTGTSQTVHYVANEIAPTTRSFTPGVFPHIWDPTGTYNDGHTGGPGMWQHQSPVAWDDLPSSIPFSPGLIDTAWDNDTHANDIAVFGGDPGSGAVKVCGPILVGGFQFDNSGYDIQGGVAGSGCTTNGTLTLAAPSGLTSVVDTGANNAMISAPIAGASGLTKAGTGTLALTGANSYTGPTTINAGTLLLGGDAGTNNTVVTVHSGGVLGGNGTVSGAVSVDPGGAVLGGNGTSASGVLTIADLDLQPSIPNPSTIIKLVLGPGGVHSTLNRAGGTWDFNPNQAFTIVNLGAQPQPVFYNNIITGLVSNPIVGTWHITNPGFAGTFVYDSVDHAIDLTLTGVPLPLTLVTAVSIKNHGAAGPLTIPLNLSSPFSVECRNSGGNHSFVFTFSKPVVSGSAILATTGTGSISGSPIFDSNTMTVNLTGVSDVQFITMTLRGVTDNDAQVLADTAVSAYMLVGDTTGNTSVSSSDVSQTKLQSGTIVANANCRQDVNVNGTINTTDISLVKARVGMGLPKPAR